MQQILYSIEKWSEEELLGHIQHRDWRVIDSVRPNWYRNTKDVGKCFGKGSFLWR